MSVLLFEIIVAVEDNLSLALPYSITSAFVGLRNRQWIRYGVAGGMSAAVDLLVFYLLAKYALPCLDVAMGDETRAIRFTVNKTIAFGLANGFSYWLSARWVFTRGRHARVTEITLFLLISTLSYVCAAQLARWLISDFALATELAAVACIGVATVSNFVLRKLVVFQG